MLARQLQQPVCEIVYRTSGQTHGPITRLMSPFEAGIGRVAADCKMKRSA
jgi:hypothetical protein